MSRCFCSGDLLLPKDNFDKWAVIACDQHTSDLSYWESVKNNVGDAPSALNLILPEAELHLLSDARIDWITQNMEMYLSDGTLVTYPNSFVYVERVLTDGSVRQGVVGIMDLERYDIDPKDNTLVFATEGTVPERLPPRIRIRQGAPMELSHCVVFCDDKEGTLIETVGNNKNDLKKLYGFDLMCGGGRIDGWLIDGAAAEEFEAAIDRYEQEHIYLVGDGNHSLLTAKRCYENMKEKLPREVWENTPARFAMVELENIHSPAMCFEPIYRLIDDTDPDALIRDLEAISTTDGVAVQVYADGKQVAIKLPVGENELTVEVLQNFLDKWLRENQGQIDYIHGKDVLIRLAQKENSVGILLPDFDKSMLFPYIRRGKITPRKTFSIGHASEKRYYVEGRKIL